jgi:type VI protein secretion system component Hcp
MKENTTDLMMRFVLNQNPVEAECTLDIAQKDKLMEDFVHKAGSRTFGNYFEVRDFSYGLSLKENDESSDSADPLARAVQASLKPAAAGAFARWRSASQDVYTSIKYPVEFDRFSFRRTIDCASPILFQSCCTSQTFDSAVLVKRTSQGSSGGVDLPSVGFLRIEFTQVLITSIDWDDDDIVTEACNFICKGMKITYRRQTASGIVSSGTGDQFSAVWPKGDDDRTLGVRSGGQGKTIR